MVRQARDVARESRSDLCVITGPRISMLGSVWRSPLKHCLRDSTVVHERKNMEKAQSIQRLWQFGLLEMLCRSLELCVHICHMSRRVAQREASETAPFAAGELLDAARACMTLA